MFFVLAKVLKPLKHRGVNPRKNSVENGRVRGVSGRTHGTPICFPDFQASSIIWLVSGSSALERKMWIMHASLKTSHVRREFSI